MTKTINSRSTIYINYYHSYENPNRHYPYWALRNLYLKPIPSYEDIKQDCKDFRIISLTFAGSDESIEKLTQKITLVANKPNSGFTINPETPALYQTSSAKRPNGVNFYGLAKFSHTKKFLVFGEKESVQSALAILGFTQRNIKKIEREESNKTLEWMEKNRDNYAEKVEAEELPDNQIVLSDSDFDSEAEELYQPQNKDVFLLFSMALASMLALALFWNQSHSSQA